MTASLVSFRFRIMIVPDLLDLTALLARSTDPMSCATEEKLAVLP